jgi:hypothetical protein
MTQPHSTTAADKLIAAAERRVTEQEERLRSMIVQGAPTQAAEDLLCQLHATLREMKEHRRLLRASQRVTSPSSRAFPEGLRGPRQPR